MRFFASVMNWMLLGLLGYALSTYGLPKNATDAFSFFIMFVTAVANLVFIISGNRNPSLASLYLQRKALEEQEKIDKLTKGK